MKNLILKLFVLVIFLFSTNQAQEEGRCGTVDTISHDPLEKIQPLIDVTQDLVIVFVDFQRN